MQQNQKCHISLSLSLSEIQFTDIVPQNRNNQGQNQGLQAEYNLSILFNHTTAAKVFFIAIKGLNPTSIQIVCGGFFPAFGKLDTKSDRLIHKE